MILWKYQQKEDKKYKGSLSTWRITCRPEPAYAYKRHAYWGENMYMRQFCGFAYNRLQNISDWL